MVDVLCVWYYYNIILDFKGILFIVYLFMIDWRFYGGYNEGQDL